MERRWIISWIVFIAIIAAIIVLAPNPPEPEKAYRMLPSDEEIKQIELN